MADEQTKNSANLGELFVEFGSKGMGGLIKGLNSVSASFLLTKNAAQQMLQPIANMSKQAGQGVISLDKLNSVTGISVKQLQRLKQWTELNNIDFSDYIGQVHSLQQALARMYLGDESALQGFAMLGLNPRDFNPAKPLENMDKIKKAMLDMYKRGGEGAKFQIALALQLLGLNEDLAYSFMNANKQIDESLLLTDRQTNSLREQNDAWNALKVACGSFFDKIIADTPAITKSIEFMTNKLTDLVKAWDKYQQRKQNGEISKEEQKYRNRTTLYEAGAVASTMGVGAAVGTMIAPGIGTATGALIGGIIGIPEMIGISKSRQKYMNANIAHDKAKKQMKLIDKGKDDGYVRIISPSVNTPFDKMYNRYSSPYSKNLTDYRRAIFNINVTQNIEDKDAREVADGFITELSRNGLITQSMLNWAANLFGGYSDGG